MSFLSQKGLSQEPRRVEEKCSFLPCSLATVNGLAETPYLLWVSKNPFAGVSGRLAEAGEG